jgi:hypothetical protein
VEDGKFKMDDGRCKMEYGRLETGTIFNIYL